MEEIKKRKKANRIYASGSDNHQSVLKESDIPVIRAHIKDGVPRHWIAKKFGVSYGTIQRIAEGKAWKHVLEDNTDSPAQQLANFICEYKNKHGLYFSPAEMARAIHSKFIRPQERKNEILKEQVTSISLWSDEMCTWQDAGVRARGNCKKTLNELAES